MASVVDSTTVGAKLNASDELFEGDPRPLPYPFEKELINNANKHIHLHEEFVPVTKVFALATKFHARHEQNSRSTEPERFLRYTQIAQSERRTQLGLPRLESQVYGWLPLELKPTDISRLNFLHAPMRSSRMTLHVERINAERVTERPGFNGLRFLLQ